MLFVAGIAILTAGALAEGPSLKKSPVDESVPKTEQEIQCEAGDAESCCQAAAYFKFLAPTLNPLRAGVLHERGCKLGAKACCDALELERKGIVKVLDVEVPAPVAKGRPEASELPPLSKEEQQCAFVQCDGKGCGCELLKEGWKEIARCPGHQWRYVLEKGGKRVLCYGISAFAGPTEKPCTPFTGELEKFKYCSEELRSKAKKGE